MIGELGGGEGRDHGLLTQYIVLIFNKLQMIFKRV